MSYRESQNNLKTLILANYPLISVISDDESPVVQTLKVIGEKSSKKHHVFTWNAPGGLICESGGVTLTKEDKKKSHVDMINFIDNYQYNSIFVLHDYHLVMKNNPDAVLNLKELILRITKPMTKNSLLSRYEESYSSASKHVVLTMPDNLIPPEINKLMNLVYFGLPGRNEISSILDEVLVHSKNKKNMPQIEKEKIINSCLGLTETEIFNAISKSILKNKGYIDAKSITEEKEQIIKKDGLLEYHPATTGLNEVGGLSSLINWIKKRRLAYDETIRKEYNLELPKGLLMTGIQGCGKSHSVKAIANFLEMPLIRLDVGSLMNKWVGESESNIRKAIKVAESVAPAVLWIDEIDKVIPDPRSANSHETTKRIFSTLLTWLQEKTSPVFVVATANNIDHLPPELMRKGRFDEIFFIDLPKPDEQIEILNIHLKKKGYSPETFQLTSLLEHIKGFSGSELQVLISESMFEAALNKEKLQLKHLIQEAKRTSPLSVTMKDKIDSIRKWAEKNNIRPAS